MNEHTPGPWTVEWVEDSMFDSGAIEGVAEIKHDTEDGRAEETLAAVFGYRDIAMRDARLIAAAPELLGALKEAEAALEFAISTIKGKAPEVDWEDSSPRKGLRTVQAAIAKARGEA